MDSNAKLDCGGFFFDDAEWDGNRLDDNDRHGHGNIDSLALAVADKHQISVTDGFGHQNAHVIEHGLKHRLGLVHADTNEQQYIN